MPENENRKRSVPWMAIAFVTIELAAYTACYLLLPTTFGGDHTMVVRVYRAKYLALAASPMAWVDEAITGRDVFIAFRDPVTSSAWEYSPPIVETPHP